MSTLTQEPESKSPVLVRSQPDVSTGQRVAVWSGVVGLSLLTWTVAFSGLSTLLG